MKKIIFFIMFLLTISLASAAVSKDYGYVKLNKQNLAPEILELSFSSELFAGESVSCNVIIDDENPETVELKTEWYVNNVLAFEGVEFSDFKKSDIVECLITPVDQYGVIGIAKGISLEAKTAPFSLTGLVISDNGKNAPVTAFAMIGLIGLVAIKTRRRNWF